jgi:hypothetical protein
VCVRLVLPCYDCFLLATRCTRPGQDCHVPEGTIMTTSRMMMPTMRHMRIFMSFHHICLRTRLAPLRKPWADWARLSVLSWSESRRAPRSETLLMLSRMMPTVLSISCLQVSIWDTPANKHSEVATAGPLALSQTCCGGAQRPECVTASAAMMRTLCTLPPGAARLLRCVQGCGRRCDSAASGGGEENIPPGALLCGGCHSGPDPGPGRLAGHLHQRWECTGRTAARGRPWWME